MEHQVFVWNIYLLFQFVEDVRWREKEEGESIYVYLFKSDWRFHLADAFKDA